MRITPLDVRKQEFRKVVRGLDSEEVYAFLATLADEYETVLTDNKQLRERVLELDEKVAEYRNMEKTLRDTLLTAERVMADAKENARKEGAVILREARIQAEQETARIAAQIESLRSRLRDLSAQRDAFLARLRGLAETQLGLVESYAKDFEADAADARSAPRAPEPGSYLPPAPRAMQPAAPARPTPPPAAGDPSLPRTPDDSWKHYETSAPLTHPQGVAAGNPAAPVETTRPSAVFHPEAAPPLEQSPLGDLARSLGRTPAEPATEWGSSDASPAVPPGAPPAPVETHVDGLPRFPPEGFDPAQTVADMVADVRRMEGAAPPLQGHDGHSADSVAPSPGADEAAPATEEDPAAGRDPAFTPLGAMLEPPEKERGESEDASDEPSWSMENFTRRLGNL